MSNRSLSSDSPQPVHHIVAGYSAWFIDNKKPVHIITVDRVAPLANSPGGNRI
jgi:hypothetical protein